MKIGPKKMPLRAVVNTLRYAETALPNTGIWQRTSPYTLTADPARYNSPHTMRLFFIPQFR